TSRRPTALPAVSARPWCALARCAARGRYRHHLRARGGGCTRTLRRHGAPGLRGDAGAPIHTLEWCGIDRRAADRIHRHPRRAAVAATGIARDAGATADLGDAQGALQTETGALRPEIGRHAV